ncbi:MAG: endonuclease G [Colwellia sp.]|jgi:endonuclease G
MNIILKFIPLAALALFAFTSSANTGNCEHVPYGKPAQNTTDFCREGYALGYDMELKSAKWVSYKLLRDLKGGVDRQDDFREDPDIPSRYRTTVKDYVEPIYDMGHLGNSESIDQSVLANSQTFLMSNMVPQLPGHNRSIWKGLENRERKYADKLGMVFVFTGPIYSNPLHYIGNKVPVPSALWKVIYSPSTNKVIAFLIPHEKLKTSQLNKYLVSVDEIERISGLDLFESFDDVKENSLESYKSPKQW